MGALLGLIVELVATTVLNLLSHWFYDPHGPLPGEDPTDPFAES